LYGRPHVPTGYHPSQPHEAGLMRVLHVYKTYYPEDDTGIPRVIHTLAEAQSPLGVETRVMALLDPRYGSLPLPVGSHTVRPVPRDLSIASTSLAWRAFPVFAEEARAADIVHYHFPWPFADLLHQTLGRGKPSVVTYHSDIVRQKLMAKAYRPLLDRFLGSVDAIVATSPNYVLSSTILRGQGSRVTTIPIGLPDRQAPDAALVDGWRTRVGEGFFLFVGAPRYYKGLGYLIEAARETGLPVVLAGRAAGATPELDNLPANVVHVGGVSEQDKEALLALSRAFVFPSHLRSEAFGVALLEAARAGRPMISCDIGTGTSYVNRDGVTGYAVAPADPLALASAMKALDQDDDLASGMGEAARLRYQALFTARAMGQAYLELYQEILSRRT
jgi:glycosyltransferase involved in cell wall biosynthesis